MSIIEIEKKHLETPYEFEANGNQPEEKMYSSLFVQLVMKKLGINISRTTKEQFKEGKEINIKDMIPGDCIYYDNGKGIEDMGLYIGNNTIIHTSSVKGKVVKKILVLIIILKLLENFYINIEKDNLYFKLELL